MKALGFELALLLMAASVGRVAAQPEDERRLRDAADQGDLALLDLVHEGPDDAVVELLGGARGVDAELAAVRACPALEALEACVPRLAEVATGRDPDLAPAASLALWQVAARLDADGLARREATTAPLVDAARSLDGSAERGGRPDLARLWLLAAGQLRAAAGDGAAETR